MKPLLLTVKHYICGFEAINWLYFHALVTRQITPWRLATVCAMSLKLGGACGTECLKSIYLLPTRDTALSFNFFVTKKPQTIINRPRRWFTPCSLHEYDNLKWMTRVHRHLFIQTRMYMGALIPFDWGVEWAMKCLILGSKEIFLLLTNLDECYE